MNVNVQKLKDRLSREAKANPGKAALLGGMFLIGIYFWAPLLASWMGSGNAAGPAKGTDPNADLIPGFIAMTTTPVPDKTSGSQPAKIAWKLLASWLDRDPRINGTAIEAPQRDPFRDVEPPPQDQQHQAALKALAAQARPRATPQQLGLTLEGTLIGTRQKTAVINGKIYREGQPIQAGAGEHPTVFELREVRRQSVVLSAENERYELRIPSLDAVGAREIAGNNR